jgi:hypothetical protein
VRDIEVEVKPPGAPPNNPQSDQIFTATFLFRTYLDDKLLKEETEPLIMSYYTYPHLRALFLLASSLMRNADRLTELRWTIRRSRWCSC